MVQDKHSRYRERHRQMINERERTRYANLSLEQREHKSSSQREYFQSHKSEIIARQRKQKECNRSLSTKRNRQYHLNYMINSPEKYKAKARAAWKARNRKVVAVSDGTVTSSVITKLLQAPNCPYCQERLETACIHIDHMHPLALGGRHTVDNLIACCQRCNSLKGAVSYADWIELVR